MDEDEKLLSEGEERTEDQEKQDILSAVESAVRQFDAEEATSRLIHLEQIRKADFFWEGEHEYWRHPLDGQIYGVDEAVRQGLIDWDEVDDYNKQLNIYRGHGESVIAAMSVEVPKTRFFPKNPRSARDITTAKEYRKIAELIELTNNARGKIRKAYFTLWRQHFVAAYIYSHEDAKYGTYEKDVKDFVEKEVPVHSCPDCGEGVEPLEPEGGQESLFDEGEGFDYDDDPSGFEDPEMPMEQENLAMCPNCGVVEPKVDMATETSYEKVDVDVLPKRRVCIDVYGPKHVKVGARSENQDDCILLIFEKELHVAQLKMMYPDHKDKIRVGGDTINDKEVRQPVTAPYDSNNTYLTHRLVWLRPAAYEMDEFADVYETLKEHYPNGALIPMVEDTALVCLDYELDPCWEISVSPVSDTIHATPMGKQVMPAQEIDTEVLHLQIDTMRHTIGETYINPAAVDTKNFNKTESAPGLTSPLKPRPGLGLSAEIHETRPVTLSQGAEHLQAMVNARAQFLAKDYPALHGGPGSQETATGHQQDLQQNLQSLGIPVDMVREWWMRTIAKACHMFKETMQEEEEAYSTRMGRGATKVNVISQKRLNGEVGEIYPDTSPAFPQGWEGKRASVERWMGLSPEIGATALHPENTTFMKELIGVEELFVPGELDREKQLIEINELMQGAAEPSMDPATGQPMLDPKTGQPHMRSSVQVDYMDDDAIHIQTIKAWAIDDEGMLTKKEQPEIYENIMWHAREHEQAMAMKAAAEAPPEPPPGDVPPPNTGGA